MELDGFGAISGGLTLAIAHYHGGFPWRTCGRCASFECTVMESDAAFVCAQLVNVGGP
jgi:hypothetical protein